MMSVGTLLKEKRQSKKFTQKQLAEYLKVSPNYISDIECDRRAIGDVFRLLAWAGYLGITNYELITASKEQTQKAEIQTVADMENWNCPICKMSGNWPVAPLECPNCGNSTEIR